MNTDLLPSDPAERAQLVRFLDTLFDLTARATYTTATNVHVRELVISAEHFIDALERVDAEKTLDAADHGRWTIGCLLADMDVEGFRACGIFMLVDVCADHPEVTGPLITRLATRLRQGLLDEHEGEHRDDNSVD